ncbi:MAG: deoxyribodipyrimidine photo-lyase [Culicoidibacterales bacterium]
MGYEHICKEGKGVLYYARHAIRLRNNPALTYAKRYADEHGLPLRVIYYLGLHEGEQKKSQRQWRFLFEGVEEFAESLIAAGINVEIFAGVEQELVDMLKQAQCVVFDVGYLRAHRKWQTRICEEIQCRCVSVETNVLVPVEEVLQKQAYSAGVFRPKYMTCVQQYLCSHNKIERSDDKGKILGKSLLNFSDFCANNKDLIIPIKYPEMSKWRGGSKAAEAQLQLFIKNGLCQYGKLETSLHTQSYSQLSPYLHFGHISPLTIYFEIIMSGAPQATVDGFLEQLLVRRELAINFVYYCPMYDQFPHALPQWSRQTLARHISDIRTHTYTYEILESGQTHDPIWNEIQNRLVLTGEIQSYLRMYWGKKVIEWTKTYEQAWEYLIRLNDTYALDGQDPNGYTGIAWCFGLHDRAFKERVVFGKIRYMNETGIKKRQRSFKKEDEKLS